MPTKVEISYKTIIFTVLFLLALWIVYQILDIILLVFVSFILMAALRPWAEYLRKYSIPGPLSVLLIYVLFLILLVFAGSSIVPPLVTQTAHLLENLPGYVSSVLPFIKIDFQMLVSQVAPYSENLVKVTVGLFSNIVTVFTVFVISFYLILERRNLGMHLINFMGEKGADRLLSIVRRVEVRLGAWIRGQIALMFSIGLATYIGLTLIGIPYVLPLAIIAGFLEIVPTVGPIISAIPAILVALTISPLLALATAVLYFVIQQLENQLIVPLVMKRVVGLPPLVTLLSLMIGAKLAGIGGAILAVPIFVAIETVVSEYIKLKEIQIKAQ